MLNHSEWILGTCQWIFYFYGYLGIGNGCFILNLLFCHPSLPPQINLHFSLSLILLPLSFHSVIKLAKNLLNFKKQIVLKYHSRPLLFFFSFLSFCYSLIFSLQSSLYLHLSLPSVPILMNPPSISKRMYRPQLDQTSSLQETSSLLKDWYIFSP